MTNKVSEKEVVLFDSNLAATFQTNLSGWVSRNGHYWGEDERAAQADALRQVIEYLKPHIGEEMLGVKTLQSALKEME